MPQNLGFAAFVENIVCVSQLKSQDYQYGFESISRYFVFINRFEE
jgi:hypothetical protein